MAEESRLLSKLPTVRGVVNQKIRDLSDDQTACRSASHLDVPREREKQRKEEKLTMVTKLAPQRSHMDASSRSLTEIASWLTSAIVASSIAASERGRAVTGPAAVATSETPCRALDSAATEAARRLLRTARRWRSRPGGVLWLALVRPTGCCSCRGCCGCRATPALRRSVSSPATWPRD